MDTNTTNPNPSTSPDGTTGPDAETYDVVVVGGGAAGLSAALTLSRSRRSVLVIDAGDPRNAPAGHVHNYLGREGTPPLELVAIGRAEVESYGGRVVTDRVTGAERSADGTFRIERRDGDPVQARRLVLTAGLTDELPDVEGLAERWGTDVLHCPYCHGWEVRDQRIVILSTTPMAVHHALHWRQWSPHVTVIAHTPFEPTVDEAVQLRARGIEVVAGPAAALEVDDDRLTGVRLSDGRVVGADAVVVTARIHARAEVLEPLGLAAAPFLMGDLDLGTHVESDPMGATSVPGIWAAGNVTNPMATVIAAAAQGQLVASAVNIDLVQEDTRLAVEALSASQPA